jgi:seryl-tRNA synthetase
MIDIQFLRDNPEKVKEGVAAKGYKIEVVDEALQLDEQRRQLIQQVQDLRTERNKVAKERNIERGKEIKQQLQELEPKLTEVEEKFEELFKTIPNLPADDAPRGKNEDENVEVRKWGEVPQFSFQPKDHVQIGQDLDLIDFENGAKVSGSQFYYLKNEAVLLEMALLQFGLEVLQQKGFIPVITPDLAQSRYYLGTGYQPKGDEAQIYEIAGEDLGLIATAEVTMAGYHADEVLMEKELPKKYAAISHAYRQEAGAYGKYSKGLYRVHQFTKLEMFAYTTPDQSNAMHQEFLAIEEELLQKLNIPYRVLEMCTGDLGAMAAKKYDLEAWMPGRGDYGEVTSTSNTTDYQARNLNIKYRAGDHNEYAHLLNGTAFAISRTLIAILENYQQEDGSVLIPEVLQKWVGKEKIEVK